MSPDDPRHGTPAGRFAHKRAGHPEPCDPCKAAATRDQKIRRLEWQRGTTRTVPVLGTRRRLRALSRIGWPTREIARLLGWNAGTVNRIMSGRIQRVSRDTAAEVTALYDRLSMTLGPNQVTATRAATKGWPGPMAWDDPDNPRERPKDRSPHAARIRRPGPETEESRRAAHAAYKRGERTPEVSAGEEAYQEAYRARRRQNRQTPEAA